MQPRQLASLLRDPTERARTVVVDVRDDDHVGGHIKGSLHVPSRNFYERVHKLVVDVDDPAKRTAVEGVAASIRDDDKAKEEDGAGGDDRRRIVFHCSLSQQRGPKAARAYVEARDLLTPRSATATATTTDGGRRTGAEVYVLEGGFVNWQSQGFAEDDTITDKYDPEIWRYGFQG